MRKFGLLAVVVVIFTAFLLLAGKIEKSKQKSATQNSTSSQQEIQKGSSTPSNAVNQNSNQTENNGTALEEPSLALNITQPQDGAVVKSANLTVSGKTVPNADVFVNDSELKTNSNGNFSTTITLDEGGNDIVVAANDSTGASIEKSITVTYEP